MSGFVSPDVVAQQVCADLLVIDEALARLGAADTSLCDGGLPVLVVTRLEKATRVAAGVAYRSLGQLALGGRRERVAVRDRIAAGAGLTLGEVRRRFAVAARICVRRGLTGERLEPLLPELSAAIFAGAVGDDHIRAVCRALDGLPRVVGAADRVIVERVLVDHARRESADFVAELGRSLAQELNPDTVFDEQDRRRRRGLVLGRQRPDGMSWFAGWVNPAVRAYLEVCAAAVRPGHRLPEDTPDAGPSDGSPSDGGVPDSGVSDGSVPDGSADPEATDPDTSADSSAECADEVVRDTRTKEQRLHDGLELGLRAGIESGSLGTHRGIAVTVIATATVAELEQAAAAAVDPGVPMSGPARTGGGSFIPMRDLIAMAAGSVHYLAVFDKHLGRPLYLGRSRRLATADQRLICYARDRGCTHCSEPGYHCEVHHNTAWIDGGGTDADNLFFACGPANQAVADGLYRTERTEDGRLAWTDITNGQRPKVNTAHHVSDLLNSARNANAQPPPKPVPRS